MKRVDSCSVRCDVLPSASHVPCRFHVNSSSMGVREDSSSRHAPPNAPTLEISATVAFVVDLSTRRSPRCGDRREQHGTVRLDAHVPNDVRGQNHRAPDGPSRVESTSDMPHRGVTPRSQSPKCPRASVVITCGTCPTPTVLRYHHHHHRHEKPQTKELDLCLFGVRTNDSMNPSAGPELGWKSTATDGCGPSAACRLSLLLAPKQLW
jgi:hypothetical protein